MAKQLMAETGKTKCKWWARVDGKRSDMHCTGTRDVLPRRRVITGHSGPHGRSLQANSGQLQVNRQGVSRSVGVWVGGWMDGWEGVWTVDGWRWSPSVLF